MRMNLYPFICLIACVLGLATCSEMSERPGKGDPHRWMSENGKVKVLSTIAMIDDLVKQIGGGHVDNSVLIKGELDPHSYQLVKGDDEKLAFAHVIFYNGLGLEHGPSLQHYLQQNKKAVALGNMILQHEPAAILNFRGQMDPHIWMDISLWSKTIPFIVQALSQADPSHAGDYHANGSKLQEDMLHAHEEIKIMMMEISPEKRYLVTSHDAFNYFTRSYLATPEEIAFNSWQKRFAAPEGLAPESQLSVTDIQLIIDHLGKHHIQVLFPESNVSRDSIKKIVQAGKEKGLDLTIANASLYADAMGKQGSEGDSYLKMIAYNAKTIAEYLKGNDKERTINAKR
jgi:manganese/zinc/iron transport system substrate-binding protein